MKKNETELAPKGLVADSKKKFKKREDAPAGAGSSVNNMGAMPVGPLRKRRKPLEVKTKAESLEDVVASLLEEKVKYVFASPLADSQLKDVDAALMDIMYTGEPHGAYVLSKTQVTLCAVGDKIDAVCDALDDLGIEHSEEDMTPEEKEEE